MKLLSTQGARESTTRVTFFVDATGGQVAKGTDGASEVFFELRRFTGRDERELADISARVDKRGRPATPLGALVREKVTRAVVSFGGLEGADDQALTKFTHDVFDGLPGWMANALLSEVNELNGFDEGE